MRDGRWFWDISGLYLHRAELYSHTSNYCSIFSFYAWGLRLAYHAALLAQNSLSLGA